MFPREWLIAVVSLFVFQWPASSADNRLADTKPNIVVILSDDMGDSDIGCYGGEIATPNLDKLAAGSPRFTQFYNTARCCPTRASLHAGQKITPLAGTSLVPACGDPT